MRFRIWPRSLAGQLMTVTALSLLLAQSINLALLVSAQRNERVVAIAAVAATRIGDVADRVAEGQPIPRQFLVPFDQQGDEARGARTRGPMRLRRIIVSDQPVFAQTGQEWPEVAQQVSRSLAADSGIRQVRAARGALAARSQRRVDGPREAELVAVAAQLTDGRWVTVRARVPMPRQRVGTLLIGQTLFLFGLLLGPLLFVAWRVSRPLARLVAAAGALRPGADSAPLVESGPRDVRELTAAFNDMRARIMTLLSDKDRMLGAIGHDLRTPLASLRVRAEQVADDALRSKMAATIDDMAIMLNDILSLARAGQPLEPAEPTDLTAMLASLVDEYREMDKPVQLAERGATVTLNLRGAAMRGAVRNLVDNAVTYAGSATVGLERVAGDKIAIVVDDIGPGIPEDRIAAMMEPFTRAETSRNRATGGSGLGLALARAAAQAEGGALSLSNRSGGGLSARIILPEKSADQT